ncbi:MAG: 4Fe-4S dicluster domain-containing protein [Candidatus Caldarchaeales archaeon]
MHITVEALKNIFKKASTEEYPLKKKTLEGYRGRPIWIMEKCVGCSLCVRICPVKAIQITGKGKEAVITFLLDRCICCAQCVESCNVKAIEITREFEFAGYDRSRMKYVYTR